VVRPFTHQPPADSEVRDRQSEERRESYTKDPEFAEFLFNLDRVMPIFFESNHSADAYSFVTQDVL